MGEPQSVRVGFREQRSHRLTDTAELLTFSEGVLGEAREAHIPNTKLRGLIKYNPQKLAETNRVNFLTLTNHPITDLLTGVTARRCFRI